MNYSAGGRAVAFLSDETVAAAGREEVAFLDVPSGEEVFPPLTEGEVSGVLLRPDGLLITTGIDNIGLWRLTEDARWTRLFDYRPEPTGTLLEVSAADGRLRFQGVGWRRPRTGRDQCVHDRPAIPGSGAFRRWAGQRFLSRTITPEFRWSGRQARVDVPETQAVAVSPDGRTVAVGGADEFGGIVLLWEEGRTRPIRFPGTESVCGLAFSSDGRTLAVAPWTTDGWAEHTARRNRRWAFPGD